MKKKPCLWKSPLVTGTGRQRRLGGGWGKRNRWGRRAVLRAEGKAVIALERKP